MATAQPDRIVIADDDEAMRELLRTLLSYAPSVEVVGEAADGHEAVVLALQRRADAVLLDMHMPLLDGARAAEVIRTYRPRVKVLFHTAKPDEELRRRAERLDAPILLKGDPGEAMAALADLLGDAGETIDPIVATVLAGLQVAGDEAVLVVRANGEVLFYDTKAAALLGERFPRPGPVDDLLERHALVHADGSPCARAETPIGRALAERRPVTGTMSEQRPDGTIHTYDVKAFPLLDEGGGAMAVAAYFAPVG